MTQSQASAKLAPLQKVVEEHDEEEKAEKQRKKEMDRILAE